VPAPRLIERRFEGYIISLFLQENQSSFPQFASLPAATATSAGARSFRLKIEKFPYQGKFSFPPMSVSGGRDFERY
jgi:hypothetical protein